MEQITIETTKIKSFTHNPNEIFFCRIPGKEKKNTFKFSVNELHSDSEIIDETVNSILDIFKGEIVENNSIGYSIKNIL